MSLAPREHSMAPARTREGWVDVAKGVAILLVVLFHAGGTVPSTTTGGQAWEQVNVVLVSVRMPLFFLVSGLFVGRALTRPAGRYFRSKAWPPLYLFAVWTLISAALYAASFGQFGEAALDSLLMQTTLWYLAGLAIHMSVAWVLRAVPPAVQIGGAALLAAPFAIWLPFEWGGLAHIPNYLVFFLVGCHARPLLTRIVRGAGLRRSGLLLAACVGLLGLAVLLRRTVPDVQELQAVILFALLPVVAVPFALVCCHAIAPGRAGRWLAWLGRHTLPVFLLHPLALQLLDALGASATAGHEWVAWVLPPLLAAGALAVSVVGWHLLEMHAPWLFGPTLRRTGRHSTGRPVQALPVGASTTDRRAPVIPDAPVRRGPVDELATPAFGLVPSPPPTDRFPVAPWPRPAHIPRPRRGSEASAPVLVPAAGYAPARPGRVHHLPR